MSIAVSMNWVTGWLIPASGFAFAVVYYLASLVPDEKLPVIPGFTAKEHEVFGELGAGLWTGLLLILCTTL